MRLLMAMTALGATVLGGVLMGGGAAAAQSLIQPGQRVDGVLTAKDQRMDDGSYFRCYQMQTRANTAYTVTLASSAFDAFMAAGPGTNCEETSTFNDDGPDMGTDSQIRFVGDGGPWIIRANTLGEGQTGRFQLSVSEGSRIEPTQAILPIAVGESLAGELAISDRVGGDNSYFDCYILSVRQAETIAIRLDSSDLDAYLSLYNGGQCEGSVVFTDDDSGGGTSAQIVEPMRPGTYSIRANSLSANEQGAYSLSVTVRR